MDVMAMSIECIGPITTKVILDTLVLYFDPVTVDEPADIIFLSGHTLGYNPDVIKKLLKKDTVIVGPSFLKHSGHICAPGMSFEVTGLTITTIPAYFVDHILTETGRPNNGYVISGSESVYFAGPTDVTPEMNVVEADVAIIPVITEHTTLFHALAATNIITAKVFVPVAYTTDEHLGLVTCVRFTRKCVYDSTIARKDVPFVATLNDA